MRKESFMGAKDALRRQQELLEKAKAEGRNLNSEEQREFDSMQTVIDAASTEGDVDGLQIERERCKQIVELCKDMELDPTDFIASGASIEAVKDAAIQKFKSEKRPVTAQPSGDVNLKVKTDERDKYTRAVADGMLLKSGLYVDKPAAGANDFKSMSLRDMAIHAMAQDGENLDTLMRMSQNEVYDKVTRAGFYNPTSAFPAIMDTAINKAYKDEYTLAPTTFEKFVKIGSLSDFKAHDNYWVTGPAGTFKEVPENGEIEADVPKDMAKPKRQLKTFARQFSMSRQAFINDDIGFLTTVPARYARSAKTTINQMVYNALFYDAAIYDALPLFDASHKNSLATGSAPSAEVINKMILALATQKDEFGQSIVVNPRTIVAPVGYAMDLYKIFNSPSINTTDNTQAANPLYQLRNNIQIVEDATLNALAGTGAAPWYLMADASDINTIEVDFLNGQQVPTIRRMENPGTLGFVWDIYFDVGVTVMNHRGIVRNKGVTIADPLA